MLQKYEKINIRTNGINLYEITNNIIDWINKINLSSGLLNISIQHTSASLLLQEYIEKNHDIDSTMMRQIRSINKSLNELIPIEEISRSVTWKLKKFELLVQKIK